MARYRPRKPSNEFFVEHPDGTRSDAELHEDMLSNPVADLASRRYAAERAVELGICTAEEAGSYYDLPPKDSAD